MTRQGPIALPPRPDAAAIVDTAGSSTRRLFVQLVLLSWLVLLVQSFVLLPLLQTDPLFLDLPEEVSLTRTFWSMRLIAMAALPMALGLRVCTLSVLLHGALAWWNRQSRVGDLGGRLLRAESIFLLESACTTLLLVVSPPGSLQEAESLRLRAGIDLLWQPASPHWAAWVASVNVFVAWWADRIRCAVQTTYGLRRPGAIAIAVLLGLILATARSLLLPT